MRFSVMLPDEYVAAILERHFPTTKFELKIGCKICLHIICTLIIFALTNLFNHSIQENMWTKSHSIVTNEVTKEQMWKLFADVNNWHTWDKGVEFAKLEGKFEKGNHFMFQPKGGPKLKIGIVEATENKGFTDFTKFPLAKMYGEHTFEETPNGLKLTTTMKVEGLLGFVWRKIVAQKIVDMLPEDMQQQIKTAKNL